VKIPQLRFHNPSKNYCVYSNRQRTYLGRDKDKAEERHRAIVRDLTAHQPASVVVGRRRHRAPGSALSVAEALLAWYKHCQEYYDNEPRAMGRAWEAVDVVRELYGSDPAASFRGPQMKRLLEALCSRPNRRKEGQTISRTYVNHILKAVKQCWRC